MFNAVVLDETNEEILFFSGSSELEVDRKIELWADEGVHSWDNSVSATEALVEQYGLSFG